MQQIPVIYKLQNVMNKASIFFAAIKLSAISKAKYFGR